MAHLKRLFNYLAAFGFIWICILSIPDSSVADPIIYGGNAYGRAAVIEIDLTTGPVSTSGLLFDTQAIAEDPATKLVYYFEWAGGNDLAYWNPDPNEVRNTLVRTYASTPWGLAKRAAFGPDGILYVMGDDGDLYAIDPATANIGDPEYIGTVTNIPTGSSSSGDMAFSFSPEPDSILYLYIVISENLYRVDMADAPNLSATLLDTNMIPGGGFWSWTVWTGLAICDGTLYASDVNIFSNNSSVYRIELVYDGAIVTDTVVTELFSTGTMINDLTSCPAITCNNSPPVLDPIGGRDADVGVPLEFTVMATDPDGDDNLLIYTATYLADALSLIPNSLGMTFDPDTGEFSWTPIVGQEGLYEIEFTVADDGECILSDSETITITVGNLPPVLVLDPSIDQDVEVNDPVTITVTATDPNVDDSLTYDIIGLPAGATFNDTTGEWLFSWIPSAAGQYSVTFTVTDNGDPILDDSETITITVEEPKSGCGAAPMTRDGGQINLSALNFFKNALLPLLPPLMALGLWCVYRFATRRRKNT